MGNELPSQQSQCKAPTRNATPYDWSNQAKMHKWSKYDVKDYLESLTYTDTTRYVMKKKVNGKDLFLCKTPAELAKKLKIKPEKAVGLFEIIHIQKEREVAQKVNKYSVEPKYDEKDINPTDDPLENDEDEDDCKQEAAIIENYGLDPSNKFKKGSKKASKKASSIDYNLHFEPSNSWQGRKVVNWTVYNMKSWFVSEFKDKINAKTKKHVLDAMDEMVLNGVQMLHVGDEEIDMLSAALDIDEILAAKIYNGFQKQLEQEGDDEKQADNKKMYTKDLYRMRMLPYNSYEWIILSKEPDCLMGYTEEDNIPRAQMPCKHAIASDTMFYYIKSIIEKNIEEIEIKCPIEDCQKPWDWDSCLRIADMTSEEIVKYNQIKSNRMSKKGYKKCPNCKCKSEKPMTLNQFRVQCTRCKSYDWCYACEQKWKGSGLILCGNKNCTLVSSVNELLATCDETKVTGIKDGKVPKYRACPNCLKLIEHKDACKHMKCKGKHCKTEFCFLCLAIRDPKTGWPKSCRGSTDSKEWTAGYDVACKLKGRQVFE